ncbi:hypothetical protein E4K65_44830 [Bradyrhizobium niftali]|uniref:Transposase n=1 Tax=Bradyrhizobium niftali TaxID=2560055 RepID=A0A4Y9KZ64_9BRAD|nr:hypothetical protein E4K65_44830 [Bradyrhizobium niftali]
MNLSLQWEYQKGLLPGNASAQVRTCVWRSSTIIGLESPCCSDIAAAGQSGFYEVVLTIAARGSSAPATSQNLKISSNVIPWLHRGRRCNPGNDGTADKPIFCARNRTRPSTWTMPWRSTDRSSRGGRRGLRSTETRDQFFCSEEFFQHRLVFDRSSLTRWRQREEKLQALLQESLSVATKTEAIKSSDLNRVIVETRGAAQERDVPD